MLELELHLLAPDATYRFPVRVHYGLPSCTDTIIVPATLVNPSFHPFRNAPQGRLPFLVKPAPGSTTVFCAPEHTLSVMSQRRGAGMGGAVYAATPTV